MAKISLTDQIKEAKRELSMREKACPKWVEGGTMKKDAAERHIALMGSISSTLEFMHSNEELIKWAFVNKDKLAAIRTLADYATEHMKEDPGVAAVLEKFPDAEITAILPSEQEAA